MFNCEMCLKPTGPCVQPQRVVTERRQTSYSFRSKANRPNPNHPKYPTSPIDDPGGTGWEVAREASVCLSCALELKHLQGAA